jgi:predicted MFS family arabinose efflux permease
VKRTFSFSVLLVPSGLALVAATYGLVRLAYGLQLPDVRAELGLGVTQAGLVSSGASLAYCAAALLALALADARPRVLLALAALTGGGGSFAMALAPTAGTFAAAAVVSSCAAGLVSPTMVAVLRRDPATRDRPAAQAVVNAGTGPGLVVAGLLTLVLAPDWRTAWAWSGGITLLVAALVVLAARPERPARTLGSWLPALPRSWWLTHRRVMAVSLLLGVASAAVWSYGRAVVLAGGADVTDSVVAWVAVGAGGAAAAATGPWGARVGPRAAFGTATATVGVATLVLALAATHQVATLSAGVAFGWGFVAATAALIDWTLRLDPERAASGTGLLFVVLVLGQAVGSALLGRLVPSWGYGPAFALTALVAGVAVLVALRRRRGAGATTPGRPRAGREPSRRSG